MRASSKNITCCLSIGIFIVKNTHSFSMGNLFLEHLIVFMVNGMEKSVFHILCSAHSSLPAHKKLHSFTLFCVCLHILHWVCTTRAWLISRAINTCRMERWVEEWDKKETAKKKSKKQVFVTMPNFVVAPSYALVWLRQRTHCKHSIPA